MEFIKAKTSDGINYTGILSEPKNKTDKIIIHIHGMSGDIYFNSFYPEMHKTYPENGWAFLAGEHRGTHSVTQFDKNGETVNIGNTYEIFEESVLDIQAWIDKARSLGYKQIWLQAHSMGPSKVAYYIYTKQPKDIQGLILLSPSDMIGLSFTNEQTTQVHNAFLKEAAELIKSGKGDQLLHKDLDGNILSAKTYINLFADESKEAIFNFKRPDLGFEVVNSISLPVIAFTGTKDEGIAPIMDAYKAMEILEKELKNSPRKKTIVFDSAEHDFAGFSKQIVKEILDFINQ